MAQYILQRPADNLRRNAFKDINFKKYFEHSSIRLSSTLESYFNIDVEHYHLLAFLSKLSDGMTIIDCGTHRGGSAIALAYNQYNKIYTYDIEAYKGGIRNNVTNIPENIIYNSSTNITDLAKVDPDHILSSSIFFLDIDHEGKNEMEIISFLEENKYEGMLILDDIHLNSEMKQLWSDLSNKELILYDVSKFGHLANDGGTGIVFFTQENKFEASIKQLLKS